MDAATLHARIDSGMGKAALRLGIDASIYRPSGASNPIGAGTLIGTTKLAVTADPGFRYSRPAEGGKPSYGLFDSAAVRIGDYLVRPDRRAGAGDGGTWFVAGLDLHQSPELVSCNVVMSIARPGGQAAGAGYYSGVTIAGETALMTAWPGSITLRGAGGRSEVGLPGDTALSWHNVLLPYGGVELRPGDVITTAEVPARRYTLSGVERAGGGWRMTALLAVA